MTLYKILLKSFLHYISILSTLLSLSILFGVTSEEIAATNLFKKFWWLFLVAYAIVFIINCVWYLVKHSRKKRSSLNVHNYMHNLRNAIIENISNKKNYSDDNFKEKCRTACLEIQKFIKNEFKKDVSVSIKLLKPWQTEPNSDVVLNTEVCTLCTVGDNNPNLENEKKNVSEYTAFMDILLCKKNKRNETKTTFACSNLQMLKIAWDIMDYEPYKGGSEEYKSIVVVPIRVHRDVIKANDNEFYKEYKTYGFICIDCKKTFSKLSKKELVEFVCAFADNLCVYFSSSYKMDFYEKFSNAKIVTV